MKASFNVAENGGGSYRLLAILRWVMVVIFVSFGVQKLQPGVKNESSGYAALSSS